MHTGGVEFEQRDYRRVGSRFHSRDPCATVWLLVSLETSEEDVTVVIKRNYLLAGVKDQQPVVKGRLYGDADVTNSALQLEPRTSQERTTSTLSTTTIMPSGFVASPESAQTSDSEEPVPAHSSPTSSAEEQPGYRRQETPAVSGHVSAVIQLCALSSFSSLEPLYSPSGRLLTLHPEKDQSVIWPSLIVAPVPQELFPSAPIPILVLFVIELPDIRKDREEAFECFVRAWHQTHLPSATMKLVTHYLPPHTSLSHVKEAEENTRGTLSYYVYLEGAASVMPSASYATLSSIRVPVQPRPENGAEAWQRDRDAASRYFDRARAINSDLDIPVITDERSDKPDRAYSGEGSMYSEQERERAKDELIFIDDIKGKDNMDNAQYLHVPSLVGAGTALLVVGVIGVLSFSSWRRNQGS
ncbi:hypothetical protein EDC04DRAFT_2878861 [Pisolithus marmoratus]|nr:hypothetical protein EDC04DRAFT_2878861 [Pisolithus marmoratus]